MCAVYTLLSYRVQQTRQDVHRTLARVSTVRQNTADNMTTTHLGIVIEQTSGDPCPMARVPSQQATHAPRTKTGDFKMESHRVREFFLRILKTQILGVTCHNKPRTAQTSSVAHSALTSELKLECSTTNKELHNLILKKYTIYF